MEDTPLPEIIRAVLEGGGTITSAVALKLLYEYDGQVARAEEREKELDRIREVLTGPDRNSGWLASLLRQPADTQEAVARGLFERTRFGHDKALELARAESLIYHTRELFKQDFDGEDPLDYSRPIIEAFVVSLRNLWYPVPQPPHDNS